MNIGIVVYSQTGNTYHVARELKEKFEAAGHAANIEQVSVTGEAPPRSKHVQLDVAPAVEGYDALVFGAPVQAFALASAMNTYLEQLPALGSKKVACFATKQLPFYWTGGNQAIAKMKQICQAKGADVCGTGIVIWSKTRRDQNIRRCIESLVPLFS